MCAALMRGPLISSRACKSVLTGTSQPAVQQLRLYSKKKLVKKIELREHEKELFDKEILQQDMIATVDHLKWEYMNTVTVRITPAIVGNLRMGVDGQQVPLREVAQISSTSPNIIMINLSSQTNSPAEVVKAVQNKMLVSAIAEGTSVKLNIPKPSKEIRDKLGKAAKEHAEKAKVVLRRTRQKAIASVRKNKDGVSKDSISRIEDLIQNITDENVGKVDQMLKMKTTELSKG